jgi:hypothetical protein
MQEPMHRFRSFVDGHLTLEQLRDLADRCLADARSCEDPETCGHDDARVICGHDANRMTPAEFVEWAADFIKPPPRPKPVLSARGRDRIIDGQRKRRARERARRKAQQPETLVAA